MTQDNYQQILQAIAQKHSISVEEVEREMQHALHMANINQKPEEAISNIAACVKEEIKKAHND